MCNAVRYHCNMGAVSISDKASYSKISRSREPFIRNCPIALKFDRHLGSTAADAPVKFPCGYLTNQSRGFATGRDFIVIVILDIETEPWFNMTSSYQYWESHCGDKTVVILRHLPNVPGVVEGYLTHVITCHFVVACVLFIASMVIATHAHHFFLVWFIWYLDMDKQ